MNDRERQNDFTETLREVAEIVRTSPYKPDREEILGYFKDMGLTDAQKDMVFAYLLNAESGGSPVAQGVFGGKEASGVTDVCGNPDGVGRPGSRRPGSSEERTDKYRHNSEPKALKLYLDDVSVLYEYTDDEKRRMYEELLNGNEEVIGKISESLLRDVAALAGEYASERAALEDLIQEGNLGAFMRLTELCGMGADCGYDVEEEINETVNNAMKDYVSETEKEAAAESAVVGRANLVDEARKFLRRQNDREPSVQELSEYTGLSPKELADIISAS